MTEEEAQAIAKIIQEKFDSIIFMIPYPASKAKALRLAKEIQLEYANQLNSIMEALNQS